MGPPKSSYTGTPSALALMSQRASSTPAMALWVTPPRFCRVRRSMSQYSRSTGRGSWPIRRSVMSRTQPAMPWGLRLSLHSPQPVTPASVLTFTKVQGRQPPSACRVSTPVIFIGAPRGVPGEGGSGAGGRNLEPRIHLLDLAGEEEAHDLLLRRARDVGHVGEEGPGEEGMRVGAEALGEACRHLIVAVERGDLGEVAGAEDILRGHIRHRAIAHRPLEHDDARRAAA